MHEIPDPRRCKALGISAGTMPIRLAGKGYLVMGLVTASAWSPAEGGGGSYPYSRDEGGEAMSKFDSDGDGGGERFS
jgi:hypothetical protein